MDPVDIYWYLLVGGGAMTLLAFIFGDFVEGVLDGIFHPILIFGGVTILGISGLTMSTQTELTHSVVLILAIIIALISYIGMYFFVVLPMSRAESSISHRLEDLKGMEAEIYTPIPDDGYGEITVTMTTGIKSMPAKSFNGKAIERNVKVFIYDIVDDDVLVMPMREHII